MLREREQAECASDLHAQLFGPAAPRWIINDQKSFAFDSEYDGFRFAVSQIVTKRHDQVSGDRGGYVYPTGFNCKVDFACARTRKSLRNCLAHHGLRYDD